ncbi:hypothetical protein V5799_009121 [Amblyomma americanum]|uniref:Uncharacterized protein n=1 Tax=Amblyomma americanum TaxID=6943 RepID=A0AAQ4FBK3_AMBAM
MKNCSKCFLWYRKQHQRSHLSLVWRRLAVKDDAEWTQVSAGSNSAGVARSEFGTRGSGGRKDEQADVIFPNRRD